MCDNFVHLHVHTEYSLLDGYGSPSKTVRRAKDIGQQSIAITDHGYMFGVIDFYRECVDNGLRPILGVELYSVPFDSSVTEKTSRNAYHILLLARNDEGYRNLLKLDSIAATEGFYYNPRIDKDLLLKYKSGLIVTSGCMASESSRLIQAGKLDEARNLLCWYRDNLEYFFIEIQVHNIPELIEQNKALFEFSRTLGIPMVVTNDAHYPTREDAPVQDIMLCVQTHAQLDSQERMRMSDNGYFIKTRQELRDSIRSVYEVDTLSDAELDAALDNTVTISNLVHYDNIESNRFHMPDIEIPSEYNSYDEYLRFLVYERLEKYYERTPEVIERAETELSVIQKTGFAVYFLIIRDICEYARSQDIIWNVRGSGAGSVVSYILGLSFVEPMSNRLLFSRFISDFRITTPDFDMDFPDRDRAKMIRYTIEKYGEDNVAQIVSFGRMKARAAIRDTGRAYGYSLDSVDAMAKAVPNMPGKPITIDSSLDPNSPYHSPKLLGMYNTDADTKIVVDAARRLEDSIRNTGIHAAAVIITPDDITNYTPVMRPGKTAITKSVTQLEYPTLESLGLLKIDFLGLATLTIIIEACRLINARHGTNLTPETVPFLDEEALTFLGTGRLHGVFQSESDGLRQVFRDMQPENFDDVTAAISLYRPGPLDHIPSYIHRMHGQEPIEYLHPLLEPILSDTQGIIIYQEQVIEILVKLADYTQGEADYVRKGIGKKKIDIIEKHRAIFIRGAMNNSIEESVAAAIYDDLERFALYGYNRAHATSYARITMQTAWLKAKYPLEFLTACLIVEGHDAAKAMKYITDCRRFNIEVSGPDIRGRKPYSIVSDRHIICGIGSIKYVNADNIPDYEIRKHINSLSSFVTAMAEGQGINTKMLESLFLVGALDFLGYTRKDLVNNVEYIADLIKATREKLALGYRELYPICSIVVTGEEYTKRELLAYEKSLTGVYLSGHPVEEYYKYAESLGLNAVIDESVEEDSATPDQLVMLATIDAIRTMKTKKNEEMAMITISDVYGSETLTVFPRIWEIVGGKLAEDMVILFTGRYNFYNGKRSIVADNIFTSANISAFEGGSSSATISIVVDKSQLQQMMSALRAARDSVDDKTRSTYLYLYEEGETEAFQILDVGGFVPVMIVEKIVNNYNGKII